MSIFKNESYLYELVESSIIDEIRKFHTKGTLHLESVGDISRFGKIKYSQVVEQSYRLNQHSRYHCETDPITEPSELSKSRSSCRNYKMSDICIAQITNIMNASFGVLSVKKDGTYRRSLPSAGALYPINVFVFKWYGNDSGLYLYSSVERKMILISESEPSELTVQKPNGFPSFTLIYSCDLGKATFKYGYKGYRHANIEVGLMCQKISVEAASLGISNVLWSSYDDLSMIEYLGLNPEVSLVLLAQFFGIEDV